MSEEQAVGQVRTVLGPISPQQLGICMVHEHLVIDAWDMWPVPNYSLIVDNRSFEIEVDNTDDDYRVLVDGRNYHINLVDERRVRVGGAQAGLELQGRQKVTVPMPGKIIAVLVSDGDQVEKGQGLVIVEAMKTENDRFSVLLIEIVLSDPFQKRTTAGEAK